ncbi:MAG: HisA/HisF-related TIM barrel protein, partial [Acidobacteriota bacterium]
AIIGTIAVEKPEVVEAAVNRHPDAIVVGIDARGGNVVLRGWVEKTVVRAADLARRMKDMGVPRIIYTDVERDGMLIGVNFDETEKLCRDAGVRVIASGGVSSVEDVRELWNRRDCGIEGVILGRALYEHKIDFADLCRQMQSW